MNELLEINTDSLHQSVEKKDHKEKMSGEALYIADMHFDDMIYAKIIRSTVAFADIKKITVPALPEGYTYIDANDVPGDIHLKVVTSEQPILATKEVRYIGEAICMLTGPDKKILEEIAKEVQIEYKEKPPVFSIEDAYEDAAKYQYVKGDPKKAFAVADEILEETFYTGYQEQAYIEPQGAVGYWNDGKVTIIGSLQCPYYVKNAVMQAMDLPEDKVQIIQAYTGGAFGGKEDYPSLLGCQLAVAAKKAKRPVQLILNRREDMGTTPKRHPSKITYKAAIKDKKLVGLSADIILDAGAYAGLSSVVLQRSLIAAAGVYRIEHLQVNGKAVLTNLVSNGAYRGFGAPQSFFAIEMMMNHIAKKLQMTPLEFKKEYFVKQGDSTSTNGAYHHHVPLPEMLQKAEELSSYSKKYEAYDKTQSGRFKKGIGLSLFLHGCGFTGSAEKDFIKSKVKLVKYENDKVEILASTVDMGQGLKTTLSKIVSTILEIPYEDIIIVNPDTDRVPNSGPTVASRSLMIVGKLLERAAQRLKEEWVSGKEIEIIENYKHPDMIPWDMDAFQGDAYPTYSYGINVVEVETDTLLGTTKLLHVCGVYDVGTAIDETIMRGQAEGGMLQGLGYASMEHMDNKNGKIEQSSFTDYMIPTAKDTVPFQIAFVDNLYEGGPFGAKGAGELTLLGAAPAYAAAVEQAVAHPMHQIPITPERLMEVL